MEIDLKVLILACIDIVSCLLPGLHLLEKSAFFQNYMNFGEKCKGDKKLNKRIFWQLS